MKTSKIFAALAVVGLLASCAQTDPHPMNMTQMVQNAKTSADHEALAKHYDDAAKAMQAEVENHKQLLAQYAAGSYGKERQSMKTHCEFLISTYQQAAKANSDMADAHRQMAAEAK